MVYEMKLKEPYFSCIKNGTKRIEIRLNDEKRQQLKAEDTIIFKNILNEEEIIEAKVEKLMYYDNFLSLVNSFDILQLAGKDFSKVDLLEELNQIYSLDEQNKYGVVGIKIAV